MADLLTVIANHLRFERPSEAEAWSYNVLQRLTYLFVIFVLFPLGNLDGPGDVPRLCFRGSGDRQFVGRTAIRAHSSLFRLWLLLLFLLVHVVMVYSPDSESHASDDHGPAGADTDDGADTDMERT